jgi:hypothetical protein
MQVLTNEDNHALFCLFVFVRPVAEVSTEDTDTDRRLWKGELTISMAPGMHTINVSYLFPTARTSRT